MPELKKEFEKLGFTEVVTYLNSGNVIFSSDAFDKEVLSNKIMPMINEIFGLNILVFIVLQEELQDILIHAPSWWGEDNKEIYDNLIFMSPSVSYEKFYDLIGDPKEEYEKVYNYNHVIFWSFCRNNYQKTNWWAGTASSRIGKLITIRTANTVRKIANM